MLYDARISKLLTSLSASSEEHRDDAMSVVFSPNGRELAVGTIDGQVLFFSLPDGRPTHSFVAYPSTLYSCVSMAYSPDGQIIVTGRRKVVNVKEPSVIAADVWRVSDGTKLASLPGTAIDMFGQPEAAPVWTVAWSPIFKDILAIGDGGSLRVWRLSEDGRTPNLIFDNKVARGVFGAAFSPQGDLAAADNSQVVIYQVKQ